MELKEKKSFWALMITQFFGAFNDNVLKVLVQLLVVAWVAKSSVRDQLVVLATAIFDAPFLIFSMVAGRVADRFGKPTVIRGVQIWQLMVVATAVGSILAKSIPAMMVSLFLLSMQAAFFSPAKYGVLPELMDDHELSNANGLLNTATFFAILVGTIVGSFLANSLVLACAILVLGALGGLLGSQFIEPLPPAKPSEPWAWNPLTDFIANWKLIHQDQVLKLGIIAVNYFWFMGAVLVTILFIYAKEMMDASAKESGVLLVAVTVGIAIGSFLAGWLTGHKVNLKLVPWGALGMSLFAIDLLWAWHSRTRVLGDLFFLGMSGGFYEVPLNALIQWRSPAGERGRVLATQNFLSFVAILGATGVLWILQTPLHLNPAQVLFTLGTCSLAATAVIWHRVVNNPILRG